MTATSTAGAIIESKESILFLSQSQFGAGLYSGEQEFFFGGNAPSAINAFAGAFDSEVFVDFAGLNTIIQEPVFESTNTSGHENFSFDLTSQISIRQVGTVNYLNPEVIPFSYLSFAGQVDASTSTGLILNSLILNRQGPYGWPSWKQIRGGDHPVMRKHRKDNTFSIIRRGTNYNVSSLMDYHFSYTVSEQINIPRADGGRILRGQGVSTDSVKEPRTIKNYKDIFATNRFNPLTLTKHRMKRPTDSAFVELQSLMIGSLATNQILEHQMWNADEYYYNVATDPVQEGGLLAERFSDEGDIVENFTFDINAIHQLRDTMAGSVSLRISYQNELTTYANPEIIKDLKVDEIKPHRLDAIYETWFPETNSNSRNKERELRELNYIETIYPREENTFTKNARIRDSYVFYGYPTDVRSDRTYIRGNGLKAPGEKNQAQIGDGSHPLAIEFQDNGTYANTVTGSFPDIANSVFPLLIHYKKKVNTPGRAGLLGIPAGEFSTNRLPYINKHNHFLHAFFGQYEVVNPKRTSQVSGIADLKFTNFTMSAWPLDGPIMDPSDSNFIAGAFGPCPLGSWGVSNSTTVDNTFSLSAAGRVSAESGINYGGQGQRGQGMFQNDFGNWPCGLNLLSGGPLPSIVYNRKIPQRVARQDEAQAPGEILAGEAIWSAADNKPKPFFNSYEEYAEHMRQIGQDHSLVPEFRISEFVEDYFDLESFGDINTIKDDFLSLTGAVHQHSSGDIQVGSQFFKTYGTSDFMKYFGVVTERLDVEENFDKPYDGGMVPTKLTLRCQAVKRFLPYRGFYPAEKIMELGEIFHDNYLKSGSYTAEPNNYVTGGLSVPARYNLLDHRIRNSKQQAMKLIFGPGILMNSIKAGLAVDYPVLPIRDTMPFNFGTSDISDLDNLPGITINHFLAAKSLTAQTASSLVGGNYISATGDQIAGAHLTKEFARRSARSYTYFPGTDYRGATGEINLKTNTDFVQSFRGLLGFPITLPLLGNAHKAHIPSGSHYVGFTYSAAGMTGSLLSATEDKGIPRLSGSVYVYDIDNPHYIAEEKAGRLWHLPDNYIAFFTGSASGFPSYDNFKYAGASNNIYTGSIPGCIDFNCTPLGSN